MDSVIDKNGNSIHVLSLLNTAFGPGMLALPHAFSNMGLLPGILMVFIGAYNMYFSLKLFTDLLVLIKPSDYSTLGEIIGGKFVS